MKKEKQSFTLIEILVVIVIIGILSSFIFFTINDSVEKAQIAKSKMFAESIRNNLLLNLVSEWKLDETSGTTFYDTWGSNNGTNNGAGFETDCISGGCASFNGASDYVLLPQVLNNTLNSNLWSFSLWIKGSGRILHTCDTASDVGSPSTDDRVLLSFGISNIAIGTMIAYTPDWSSIQSDTWYYATYVQEDTNTLKLYVNGFLLDTITVAGSIAISPQQVILGALRNPAIEQYFNGSIDEVQIYNAAISGAQIKQTYLSGLNSLYSKGLISDIEYNERFLSLR